MALNAGTKLGPYEIQSALGAGGMGEVYRARDTRLDRTVAIKVLPSHLSTNPDLRARFEREARAVSSLNHPHICVLHDVGHQDGTDYIVMELVEGETLLDRLKKGPLPLDQTLRYGIEIADALDKAHRHGVIHRDLKPGNVMLTKAGSKLMDFGLAKRALAGDGGGGVSALPTQEKPLTEAGSLLGTYQYMSPEQLEGKDADARADIWALGCVVYEMATGQRAFTGKSQASLISAILKDEPQPISKLQPMTPPALDRLVKVCLAKDPDDRLQTAHDVMQELKWIAEGGSQAGSAAGASPAVRPVWVRALPWTIAALGVSIGVLSALRGSRPSAMPPALHAGVDLAAVSGPGGVLRSVVVTPGGERLVVWYDTETMRELIVRDLASFETRPVLGTRGAVNPFVSPDGRWLGFYADGKIKKVAFAGGDPITICDAPINSPGAAWGPDGTILFTPSWDSGLSRVPEGGGQPAEVTHTDRTRGEGYHGWPDFLPDGRAALFTIVKSILGDSLVALLDLASSKTDVLFQGAFPRYIATGHIVFFRHGRYFAVPFDAASLRVSGEERPVLAGARPLEPTGELESPLSFSRNGILAYIPGESPVLKPYTQLAWISRKGKVEPLPFEGHHQVTGARLSPDGRRVAVARYAEGEVQIWIYDLARGTSERLTRDGLNEGPLSWHPDGTQVAFSSLVRDRAAMIPRAMVIDGSRGPVPLVDSGRSASGWEWSPDTTAVVFRETSPQTGYDIFAMREGKAGTRQPVVATPLEEVFPALSPDGRFLAYSSGGAVHVVRFPKGDGHVQAAEHAACPRWSRATRELIYLQGGKLVAARWEGSDTGFRLLTPVSLFDAPPGMRSFDVAADGQRFLFQLPVAGRTPRPEVRVRTDGFAELGQAAWTGNR